MSYYYGELTMDYGRFCHKVYTNTLLGKLRSNKKYPSFFHELALAIVAFLLLYRSQSKMSGGLKKKGSKKKVHGLPLIVSYNS
jgi:hypothetical protein